ncbi:hypothetical protein K0M31_009908 [Melipona bicolor]|uniref:Cytochrome P450 6a14 n=1 Tax=Melipona bicolor TaxID=60889 RepID=A0AA40FMY3_9HYME|nr:hypothetical protein K0M31_009908 [Melipona bicolor]
MQTIMVGYLEILCGVTALLLALYYYFMSVFSFWERLEVPGLKPAFFIKNIFNIYTMRLPVSLYLQNFYEKYKNERMFGFYLGRSAILILKDPELIKDVLVKDFSIFADRGFIVHERTEPLSLHLLNLDIRRWRPLRRQFTPMFTSSKLKNMFEQVLECATHLEKHLDKLAARNEPVDFRDIAAKYTMDVIGSCGFGINVNSFSDEESKFYKIGTEYFGVCLENMIRLKLRLYATKLYDWLGYIFPENYYAPFFANLVTETMRYRKEHDIYRPDFIQMLMNMKEHPENLDDIELTDALITAQAFIFFAAGFETSASTMSNALYELALNQDIQDKLREEIKEHYAKHGGDMKYEHVKGMKYLDKVFKETLRKYPVGGVLTRRSACPYTFRDTKVTIPRRLLVFIPVYAIHRDPDIYPNPDVFNPENFSEEAIEARHPMTYLPFGDGPRNCIGARFGLFQTKVGLIATLRNYKVDVCDKTMIPYEFDANTFLLTAKGEIYLKLTKLEA